jgi:hypothetical protein
MVLSSIGIKRLAAATVIQARMRGNFARYKRQAAATAIQARMRGCFSRDKLESDVRWEISHEHPWNPRVPSMRLQVLRSQQRRMLEMREKRRLSMPESYEAARAAETRRVYKGVWY